jgi:tetratricopeptide (TPR) repeat protein
MTKDKHRLRMFVAMPGTDMGESARWADPNQIKIHFFEPISIKLQQKLKTPVDLVIEKDKDISGFIPISMFKEAWQADVYIADLTGNNPNVYLELGVRWAMKDGVTIVVSQNVKEIRFNAAFNRAVPYSDNPEMLKTAIEKVVNGVLQGYGIEGYCDSPVRQGAAVLSFERDYIRQLKEENQRLKEERGEDLLTAAKASSNAEGRLDLLRRAISINPASVDAYLALGEELIKIGQYEESITALQQATALDSRCAKCYRELGVAYGKLKQLDKAVDALRISVRLAPDDAEAFNNLGGALRRYGLRDAPTSYDFSILREARNSYNEAAKLKPRETYSLLNIAKLDLLLSRGEPERKEAAINSFKKLQHLCAYEAETNPNNYWAKFDLADTYLLAADADEGDKKFREAMNAVPIEYRKMVFSSVLSPLQELLSAGVIEDRMKPTVERIIEELKAASS